MSTTIESSKSRSSKLSLAQRITSSTSIPNISRHANEINADIRVENCIGFTQIPLGIAGPLLIKGDHHGEKDTFAPLATVEATLVASCSRGCKAFQASGGVRAVALNEGMHRAPVFRFKDIEHAVTFYRRVPDLFARLKATADSTSRFVRLQRLTPQIIGQEVHVKFSYTCGDAAGQNGVTIATHKACKEFLASTLARDLNVCGFQLEGNVASDKKMAWGNIRDPRGVEVVAWGKVTDAAARKILGTSTKSIKTGMETGNAGSIRNGQLGNNINTANVMAAMFIACGQDAASVLEGGFSHLTMDYDETSKDLTISVYFPSIPVGTVGGGTGYSTQKEALELLGCAGAGKKWALAETIASFAMALDLSTLSAMANDTFSNSHKNFARANL